MKAINKHTKAEIRGTLEQIYGCAEVLSFDRDKHGALIWEHGGATEMYWDTSETVTRDREALFVDENGDEVIESDIELVTEEEDD